MGVAVVVGPAGLLDCCTAGSDYLIFNILLLNLRATVISEMSEVFQSHWFYEIGPLHE